MYDETKNYWLEYDKESGVYQFRCEDKIPTPVVETSRFEEIKSTELITDPVRIIYKIQSFLKRIYERNLKVKASCEFVNEISSDFIIESKESDIKLSVFNFLEKSPDKDIEYKIYFEVRAFNSKKIQKLYKFVAIAFEGKLDNYGRYVKNDLGIYLFDREQVEKNIIKNLTNLFTNRR